MPRIIISYRRVDAAAIAGRIFDRLVRHFGKNAVFMDVDSIPFGIDFRHYINDALAEIDAILVVIGPRWIGANEDGATRIVDINDPVRIEVETALRRGISVVPVLVDGAAMPAPAQLPETLKELSFRNAAEVDSGRDFHPHMDRLIRSLDRVLKESKSRTKPKSPPPRDRARGGMKPLAVGALILCGCFLIALTLYGRKLLQSESPSHAPSPSASADLDKASRLANAAFEDAGKKGTIEAWKDFLNKAKAGVISPGPLLSKAQDELGRLELMQAMQQDFDAAKQIGTPDAWEKFLAKVKSGTYPSGPLADQAQEKLQKLEQAAAEEAAWNSIKDSKNASDFANYLNRYPQGKFAQLAQAAIGKIKASEAKAAEENLSPLEDRNLLAEVGNRLYELNFDPGSVTNGPTPALQQAILQFEQRNNLSADGVASMALLTRLRNIAPLKPWGAIVYQKSHEKWGMSWGQESRKKAIASAESSCGDPEGCPIELSFFDGDCGVFVHSPSSWSLAARDSVEKAKNFALDSCRQHGANCQIIASVCADGSEKFDSSK